MLKIGCFFGMKRGAYEGWFCKRIAPLHGVGFANLPIVRTYGSNFSQWQILFSNVAENSPCIAPKTQPLTCPEIPAQSGLLPHHVTDLLKFAVSKLCRNGA